MAKQFEREEILLRLRKLIKKGRPILDATAGIGISAKFLEAGGADLITTGIIPRLRMAGLGSLGLLSIADANALTIELGKREIIPIVKNTPVTMGVLAVDATRNMEYFLDEVINAGFSGVVNGPTIAFIDGNYGKILEEAGATYEKEVEMIGIAHRKGLFTKGLCPTPTEALKMVDAGCDLIVAHAGKTAGGSTGSKSATPLDEMVDLTQKIIDVVKGKKPDVLVICHGGDAVTPDDVQYLLNKTRGLEGYLGGSSIERIPVETAITETARNFKNLHIPEENKWKG
jgi:predicted TIM-barrel enzyme